MESYEIQDLNLYKRGKTKFIAEKENDSNYRIRKGIQRDAIYERLERERKASLVKKTTV